MIKKILLFGVFFTTVCAAFSQELPQKTVGETLAFVPEILTGTQKTMTERVRKTSAFASKTMVKTQETAADKMENGTAESQEVIAERRNVLSLYEHLSREISLLNDKQKQTLSSLGSATVGKLGSQIGQTIGQLQQQGIISAQAAQRLADVLGGITTPLSQAGNNIGETIRRGLRTNTKNMYAAGIMVTQPIYMGGGIKALNDIATIGEEFAQNDIQLKQQTVLFAVDNAYWLIVSLKEKSILAIQYRNLISKLHDNRKRHFVSENGTLSALRTAPRRRFNARRRSNRQSFGFRSCKL